MDAGMELLNGMGLGVEQAPRAGVFAFNLPCGHAATTIARKGMVSEPVNCSQDGKRYRVFQQSGEILSIREDPKRPR